MFQASLAQRALAASASASLIGESEPPKSIWLALNCLTPAPEPLGL